MMSPSGYSIVSQLGEGSYGTVFRAQQNSLGRHVALKLFKWQGDAGPLARFHREAQTLARLEHPFILKVFDFELHEQGGYLATEILPAGSLLRRVRDDGPLEPDRAVSVVTQVLAALAFTHQRGVIHRDVKPANVLLAADHSVRLADFGLAFVEGAPALSQEFQPVGTPHYMAPEAHMGSAHSASMDVYSAAISLYELLTGITPTTGLDPRAIIAAKIAGPVCRGARREHWIPGRLVPVLRKALEPDPMHRFTTAKEFAHALRTAGERKVQRRPVANRSAASFSRPVRRSRVPRVLRHALAWMLGLRELLASPRKCLQSGVPG